MVKVHPELKIWKTCVMFTISLKICHAGFNTPSNIVFKKNYHSSILHGLKGDMLLAVLHCVVGKQCAGLRQPSASAGRGAILCSGGDC